MCVYACANMRACVYVCVCVTLCMCVCAMVVVAVRAVVTRVCVQLADVPALLISSASSRCVGMVAFPDPRNLKNTDFRRFTDWSVNSFVCVTKHIVFDTQTCSMLHSWEYVKFSRFRGSGFLGVAASAHALASQTAGEMW